MNKYHILIAILTPPSLPRASKGAPQKDGGASLAVLLPHVPLMDPYMTFVARSLEELLTRSQNDPLHV